MFIWLMITQYSLLWTMKSKPVLEVIGRKYLGLCSNSRKNKYIYIIYTYIHIYTCIYYFVWIWLCVSPFVWYLDPQSAHKKVKSMECVESQIIQYCLLFKGILEKHPPRAMIVERQRRVRVSCSHFTALLMLIYSFRIFYSAHVFVCARCLQ